MSISVTLNFGIVVRREALHERQVALADLLAALETPQPLAEDADLIAFGPFFGPEACSELVRRLVALGLRHVDDFAELVMDHPDWLRFRAERADERRSQWALPTSRSGGD